MIDWKLIIQRKQAGTDTNKLNGEIIALIAKLLKYMCITKTQNKKVSSIWGSFCYSVFEKKVLSMIYT